MNRLNGLCDHLKTQYLQTRLKKLSKILEIVQNSCSTDRLDSSLIECQEHEEEIK